MFFVVGFHYIRWSYEAMIGMGLHATGNDRRLGLFFELNILACCFLVLG